jgi:uncharacterized membrane protein
MPTPEQERMDAISSALAGILRQQEQLDRRLARIEAMIGVTAPPPPPPPAPAPRPVPPPQPPAAPVPVVIAEPASPPPSSGRLETSIGLTLINRVGVITLVLGIGFFFKWAVDNEWIGPAERVRLGILAGFLSVGAADLLFRRGQKVFAQGITAIGICLLYLAIYAAFGFYQLVPQSLAFLAMLLVTAMAGVLALRYEAVAIAALGLFGGFLTPILLSTGEDHPWFLFGYILALDVGALALARARSWRPLEIFSFAGTAIVYAAWLDKFNPEKQLVATVFVLLFYALFAVVSTVEPLFPAGHFLAAAALTIVGRDTPSLYCLLEILLAAAGLVIVDRRRLHGAAGVVFASFWIFIGIYAAAGHHPPGTMFIGFTCGFLLFLAWTPWRFLVRQAPIATTDLAILALNAAAYFGSSYWRLHVRYHAWLGLFAMALAAIHLALAYELWRRQPEQRRELRPILLCAGVALSCLTLAVPVQFTAYRITMAWSLEAAGFSWIGARLRDSRMIWATSAIFLLVWMRLAAIDAWIYSPGESYTAIVNERFFTFALAAVCMWLAAKWVTEPEPLRLAYYIAGHVAMLWTLTQEVLGWAGRNAAPENLVSVETISVSILYACYAVVFVSLGVATRTAVNRVAGLILIGAVVLKLYLFDVWQLGRFYRTLAFVALGVLLLSTSFLYSHFRTLIESWWKKDA